ncbi:MAG: dehydrogenase, partial [Burkholderiaceae bacterium]|nr:dehydrogenase [Burkholderiaceae bacterium]
ACHSDQALALLADASEREREILGAIEYQPNDTVLHTDARLLPRHRKAWAAWNAYIPRDPAEGCTVSYNMNLLQGLVSHEPFVVTLNRTQDIDPARILKRMRYHHPVYNAAMVAAQARKHEIQGQRGTWFAGAYWGWGFHEDGIRSAAQIVAEMERRPVQAARLPSAPLPMKLAA